MRRDWKGTFWDTYDLAYMVIEKEQEENSSRRQWLEYMKQIAQNVRVESSQTWSSLAETDEADTLLQTVYELLTK